MVKQLICLIILGLIFTLIWNSPVYGGLYPYFETFFVYGNQSGPVEDIYGSSDLSWGLGGGLVLAPQLYDSKNLKYVLSFRILRFSLDGTTVSEGEEIPVSTSEMSLRHFLFGFHLLKEYSGFEPYIGLGFAMSRYKESTNWKQYSGSTEYQTVKGTEYGFFLGGGIAKSLNSWFEFFSDLTYVRVISESKAFPGDNFNLGGVSMTLGARLSAKPS